MSGLFTNMKPAKVTSARNDDGPGTYVQKIDDIRVERVGGDPRGVPYVKVVKTNVAILDTAEGKAKSVGEQVTHAIFRDSNPKYNYFERDMRRLMKAALPLTEDEANDLTTSAGVKAIVAGFLPSLSAEDMKASEILSRDVAHLNDLQIFSALFANDTGFKAIREVMIDSLVEARVTVRPKAKKPTENFANVVYTRGVDVSEIPEAARKKFGL